MGLGGAQTLLKGIFETNTANNNIYLFALRTVNTEIKINHKHVFISENRKKYSFNSIRQIKKIISENKIDILHCHLFKSSVFGYIIKRLYFKNIKLIFHEHGNIIYVDDSGKLASRLYKLFIKKTVKTVNLYICITKAIKNDLQKYASIKKQNIKLLYNYIDIEKFKPPSKTQIIQTKKELNFKNNEYIIGFAARIVERKGWREFIKAAKIISSTHNFVRFIIAGSGEESKNLEALIKKENLQLKINYIGYCDNMYQFYSVLDCFVVPSHWEPMGITELEAQAMKIPVIASNVPGLNEIVINNKNGLLFEPKNEIDLSEKLNLLIKNTELADKIIKGGTENVSKYKLVDYNKKLIEIHTYL